MKTATQKTIEKLQSNKELQKGLSKLSHYNIEQFIEDAEQYVKAIKERRMICNIISVSSSGMSRNLRFLSCEVSRHNKKQFWYSNYHAFFVALGHTKANNGFRVNGCGMDMVFHTNYSIIHNLLNLGLLNKAKCANLAQMTPTVI